MSFIGPSESELAAVEKLQQRLQNDAAFSNTKVLRFYRGMKFDEEKAYDALQKHALWLKEENIETLHENTMIFEKELNSNKVVILDGLDHNKRPIAMCYVRRHAANDRDIDHIRMLIIHTIETLIKRSKPEEENFVICFDLTKFSYKCLDYEAVKALISIMQANYPDTLHTCLLIDDSPSWIFTTCWAMIRPWLDPVTVAKVIFSF